MQRLPRVTNELELKVEGGTARLTPREGLRLAEDLVRKSMRQAMVEGAEAEPARRASTEKRRSCQPPAKRETLSGSNGVHGFKETPSRPTSKRRRANNDGE